MSRVSASQESKFAAPELDRFARRPLDWKILADGEPPARDWAITGWLGMGHVTLLAALGSMGKSLLAQQLGSALVLGRDFVDTITAPRRVLAWFAEDDSDELWRRQVKIAAHFSVPLEAFAGNFTVESFADRDCTLMDVDLSGRLNSTAMLEELREQVADYRAQVVVLDNAARVFGGKESDRNQVTRFMAELNGAAAGAAVLLLAHPGRATGSEFSGSTAWENAVRSRLFLSDRKPDAKIFTPGAEEESPAGDRRYLAKRKTNYSGRELRTFRYENGVLIPEDVASAGGGLIDALSDRRDETVVLDAFRKLTGELGQQPTDGSTSPHFLPRLILQFNLGDGRTQRDLAQAMRRLMIDQKLRREQIGKYGNRNPRFGLVTVDGPFV